MKIESNNTSTIAVSGTLTIAREDLEALLRGIIAQPPNSQPSIEVPQPKPKANEFGPPRFRSRK